MAISIENDVTSVSIRLNELKNKFDQCMRQGDTFANVRAIYNQIRELECFLKALIWDPRTNTSSATPSVL
jgi:hypothetical protein